MKTLIATIVASTVAIGIAAPAQSANCGLQQLPGLSGCVGPVSNSIGCSEANPINNAYSVVASPDGKNIYLGTLTINGAVVVFDRNTSTGALTRKAGTTGCVSDSGAGTACQDGKALNLVSAVTISPDGKNVYALASNSDAISIFDRNTSTGGITQKAGDDGCINNTGSICADGTALSNPRSITVSPDGKSVYVTAGFSKVITIFDRDTTTGILTQKAGTAGCIGRTDVGGACLEGRAMFDPTDAAVSPDNKHVYVATDFLGVATFDRNTSTGALTQKAGADGCVTRAGATSETCAEGNQITDTNSLVVSPDGKNLYVSSRDEHALAIFDRNTSTGVITQKAGPLGCIQDDGLFGCTNGPSMISPQAVTISPDGSTVYLLTAENAIVAFNRSSATGNLTPKGGALRCVSFTGLGGECQPVGSLNRPRSLAITADGEHFYAASSQSNTISSFRCTNCGDGILNLGSDKCDDANLDDDDGCSNVCTVETGYECPTPGQPCEPVCGDGMVIADEVCDDGNAVSGDGCNSQCSMTELGFDCPPAGGACEPICGDTLVVGDEACDDGNDSDADSCLNDCTLASCGDGFVCLDGATCTSGPGAGVEDCDDSNPSNDDSCLNSCAAASCLDGFVCSDVATCTSGAGGGVESCDLGNVVNDATCLTTCQLPGGDDDADDIDNANENGGPNDGDGNGDGILDSVQDHVTSVPNAQDGSYITIVTDASCPLANVTTARLGVLQYVFPVGILGFELPGCAATTVTIYYHGLDELKSPPYRYVKFGPNPPGADNRVLYLLSSGAPHNTSFDTVSLPFDPAVGRVRYDLADGVVGDSTPIGDGIVDPGGIAFDRSTAPALSTGALFISSLTLLFVAYFRRWSKDK